MKKLFSFLMVVFILMSFSVPLFCFAETEDSAGIINASGTIYPGCNFTLYLQISTDKDAEAFQTQLRFDSEKLTLNSITSPVGWKITKLSGNNQYATLPDITDSKTVTGKNIRILKLDFSLNGSVAIGTDLEVTLASLKISSNKAEELYKGDLSYRFKVEEKPKNSNCNLIRLSTTDGTLSPAFDENSMNNDYSVTVHNSVTSLNLHVLPANEKASYEISGNEDFQVGENTVTVTVTAESGAQRVYTVQVIRQEPPSTDTTLAELSVNDGLSLTPAFDSSIFSYSLDVPADVFSLDLKYTATHEKATVSVVGNADFQVGANTVTVTVTAEDGTSKGIYTLTVNRARPIEKDAVLSSLAFEGYPFDRPFDGNDENREYRVTVPYETTFENPITYEALSKYATVLTTLPDSFEVGENVITVTVTSEDLATTLVYTVIVTREARILSSDALIKELSPSIGQMTPAFDPNVTTYILVTAIGDKVLSFTSELSDPAATISATEFSLSKGLNTIEIVSTAENGTEKVYTFYVFVPVTEQKQLLVLRGIPQVGEKLALEKYGLSENGKVTWLVNGNDIGEVLGDIYTITEADVGKTIQVVYTDSEGTVSSETVIVQKKSEPLPPSPYDPSASASESGPEESKPDDPTVDPNPGDDNSENNPGQVIFVIVAVVIALIVGGFIGRFFTKSRKH